MSKIFLTTGLASTLLASAFAAVPAMAQDQAEVTVATVRYSDLDLSTERGQDRLHDRMVRAAREVCGMDIREAGSTIAPRQARQCFVDTRASFEREVAARTGYSAQRG